MTKCQENKIIVISATSKELSVVDKIADFTIFTTGIGLINTMLNVQQIIGQHKPKLIVQLGICGAIDKSLSLGEVVCIESDFVADIGAWRNESNTFVRFNQPLYFGTPIYSMKSVKGISVNMACNDRVDYADAQVESMEGAAFFAVCNQNNVKAIQIRSVSNYIDSKREDWDIENALENLGKAIKKLNFENFM